MDKADPGQARTTLVFDGDCVLCTGWVAFYLRWERRPETVFLSSRRPLGQRLGAAHGMTPADLERSFLVVRDGVAITRSDAVLTLFGDLRRPWCWLRVLRLVPKRLRDGAYDWIARNRFRLFGRRQDCYLPTPAQRSRFPDACAPPRQGAL